MGEGDTRTLRATTDSRIFSYKRYLIRLLDGPSGEYSEYGKRSGYARNNFGILRTREIITHAITVRYRALIIFDIKLAGVEQQLFTRVVNKARAFVLSRCAAYREQYG